ncbi:MAG TPA: heliorhodopsin HeR [Propionibacteriaceae bacterium]|nr:heliorhodopsin HeR [Propionibacteriaceae bacterium]
MTTRTITTPEKRRLRTLNLGAAALHLAQAIAVVALATDFTLPITASYMAGPPGTPPGAATNVLDLSTGMAVAGFLFLSFLAHLIVGTVWFKNYIGDLSHQINRARWIEYSLSSTLMIVVISQLVGISDVTALIGIAGANVSMILFGWLQEKYEQPGNGGWLPFIFGCIAGIVPWLAILFYTIAPGSDVEPPGFVYGIVVSLFVFFNVFALNQWLQYRAKGRFADYLVGERGYIILSLVAKSLLAWQVFAGTLAA